ncbi:MAG: hypothetical protein ACRDOK_22710 [Streptosporangiaceae bacterium]
MPQHLERHSRRKYDWGGNPSRSAQVTAAADDPDPAKRSPARKDTKAWCRGKPGRGHKPVLVARPWSTHRTECGWGVHWWQSDRRVTWACVHREECLECGKVLRARVSCAECPGYPGTPEQKTAAEAGLAQQVARWEGWRARRRPVVTGPQGYRRSRAAG